MVTIFDGMEKMTEEQLRFEIALMEQVSVSAFAGVTAQKAKKASVHLANKLTSFVGAKQFAEPEIIPVPEQIMLAADALIGYDKGDLLTHLRECLCRKLENLGVKDAMQLSSERQSVLIIAKAAESVDGVPVYMTPLRKAEAVAEKNTKKTIEDFGITVLDSKLQKELLAHAVMICIQAYGQPFAPIGKTLPGYLEGEQKEQCEAAEREAWAAMEENTEFHKECVSLEHAMDMSQNQAKTQESIYRSLEEKETALLHKEAAEDAGGLCGSYSDQGS